MHTLLALWLLASAPDSVVAPNSASTPDSVSAPDSVVAPNSASAPELPDHRAFTVAQLHLLPEHRVQLQYTQLSAYKLDGSALAAFNSQLAARFALLAQLQLDMEVSTQQGGLASPISFAYEAASLRFTPWAWQELWGNPTLVARFIRAHNAPAQLDLRFVLGDAAAGWSWVASLLWQRELRGLLLLQNYELNGGAAYRLAAAWHLGWEAQLRGSDQAGTRFHFDTVVARLGPSVRWTPQGLPLDLLVVAFASLTSEQDAQDRLNTWELAPAAVLNWNLSL